MKLEILDWQIYSKKVVLQDYGIVDFTVVYNMQSNQPGSFIFKPTNMKLKTNILQR
jgi:hypothetical protein